MPGPPFWWIDSSTDQIKGSISTRLSLRNIDNFSGCPLRVDCRQKTPKLVDPQIAAMLPRTVRKTRLRRADEFTPLTRRSHSAHNICYGNHGRDRIFGVDEHQPC